MRVDIQCDPNDPTDWHHGSPHPIKIGSGRHFFLDYVSSHESGGQYSTELDLFDSETSTVTTIVKAVSPEYIDGASISGQGNRIAYYLSDDSGNRLMLLDRPSGQTIQVASMVDEDLSPAPLISADGTRILYALDLLLSQCAYVQWEGPQIWAVDVPIGAAQPSTSHAVAADMGYMPRTGNLSANGRFFSYWRIDYCRSVYSFPYLFHPYELIRQEIDAANGSNLMMVAGNTGRFFGAGSTYVSDEGVVATTSLGGALLLRSPTDISPLGSSQMVLGLSSDAKTVLLSPKLGSYDKYELVHLGSVQTSELLPFAEYQAYALGLSSDGRFIPFLGRRSPYNITYDISVVDAKSNDEVISIVKNVSAAYGFPFNGISSNVQEGMPTVSLAVP